jgi:ribonucleoside-triphosphate reductase
LENNVSPRAEIITRRTYCRPLNEEGTKFESWELVIDRVIRHQRWLWERALTHNKLPNMPLHDVTEDLMEWVELNDEQIKELEELRQLMLARKALPSGRTLWLGGTEIAKRREASMFNCSHTEIETMYDVVDAFWLLLQGCGVGFTPKVGTLNGFRKVIPNIRIIPSTRGPNEKGREYNEETFVNGIWTISIGDSAESWAKSVGKILAGKYKAHTLILDFSQIRGAGGRLSGYGWISSGFEPYSIASTKIAQIMNKRAGGLLSKTDIVEVMNLLGTVLSSRRSAEIALVEYDSDEWIEFAQFKRNCYEEGHKHKQMSNNSLVFYNKPPREELDQIFQMMIEAGGSEPGFFNGQTAKKRAPWFSGTNPCGEILLGNKSFCNLVEIDVGKFKGDSAGLHKATHLIARANYRQTIVDLRDGILQESWHKNNEFLRLCGVGATGIAKRDDMTEYDWKNMKYSAVTAARGMSQELTLEWPKNVTTVKPSGTLGKIMDTYEGVHKPEAMYLFNWVNFSKEDPKLNRLMEAGYRIINNDSDETKSSSLVCIPVNYEGGEFTKVEVTRKDGHKEILDVNTETAIEQLTRYKKIQQYYCDQNVSNTIYYKPEEKDEIVDWLLTNWNTYVGVSFLFKNDPTVSAEDLGFNYLPQEYVNKETFYEYVDSLKDVDWDGTDFESEMEDEACAGGMCPIK